MGKNIKVAGEMVNKREKENFLAKKKDGEEVFGKTEKDLTGFKFFILM